MKKIKILQIGIGPIGQNIVKYINERKNLEIVGAMDIDPDKVGKTLGELCELANLNIRIKSTLKEATENKPDIVIHTTSSSFKQIAPQLLNIIESGIPIVSTCEELSYPWNTNPELAKQIDEKAKEKGVVVLGTGVNPGFLMDSLPTFITAVCQHVEKIMVTRIQNARYRRIPFQNKIGAGLTLEEFEERKKDGSLRHVGLAESIYFIANSVGWNLTKTEDIIEPEIAKNNIAREAGIIKKGMTAGVLQTGRGFIDEKEVITLVFKAAIGEEKIGDTIEIFGEPNIKSTIRNGVDGDIATCAIAINAIKSVLNTSSGLKTMKDVPMVSYFE